MKKLYLILTEGWREETSTAVKVNYGITVPVLMLIAIILLS